MRWPDVRSWSWRRWIALTFVAVLAGVAGYLAVQGVRSWLAWRGIERVEFDLESARETLRTIPGPEAPVTETTAVPRPDLDQRYEAYLAIGSDERPPNDPIGQEGVYADAILLLLVDTDGHGRYLVSLPRDLAVVDPCTARQTKLDRTLSGCGPAVSGPEHVALAVEGYTGIAVDHYALFEFGAFIEIIDRLGGVELCTPTAVREGTADLLPAGCSVADGSTALAWIRSRETQELVDGEWRFVEGVGDAVRNQRQQDLLLALLARLKAIRSPAAIADVVSTVGGQLALDDRLSMADAVGLVWELRGVSASSIERKTIPTRPGVTADGAFVLVPTAPFVQVLSND